MDKIVKINQSSHWYYPDATPCYEVDSADGKKKVKTTLAHAKKLGLVPSVTTVLSLLAKPELDAWRAEQLLLASLTLHRLENESDQDYVKRIIADSEVYSQQAMDFGNSIHAYIESCFCAVERPQIDDIYRTKIDEFINTHKISGQCEILASNSIVAGRVDFFGEFDGHTAIIDWKTQGTKNGKVNYYDTWLYQLVGYLRLLKKDLNNVNLINVVISKEGFVDYKIWEQAEINRASQIFDSLVDLFYLIKKLDKR